MLSPMQAMRSANVGMFAVLHVDWGCGRFYLPLRVHVLGQRLQGCSYRLEKWIQSSQVLMNAVDLSFLQVHSLLFVGLFDSIYLEFSSSLSNCQWSYSQGGAMAIQCFDSIESGRYLIGGKIKGRYVIRRYLERPIGWIHECPVHVEIDRFAFHDICRLIGS